MEQKIPLLVVCGPTASGKTRLSIDLAKRFRGEIVSADSMQIYKGMTIGTAKPAPEEMRGILHHLIDFLEPSEDFSVARYASLAKACISDIHARGFLPVLAGGTGLYIQSVTENIAFTEIKSDPALRETLQRQAAEHGNAYLWQKLSGVDPVLAKKLHPNNIGRIVRALEVFEVTGRPMSEWQADSRKNPPEYELCMIGLCCEDRERLYDRIDRRVDGMLEQGLLNEAESLFERGYSKTAAQAIGYKELARYLAGEESLETAVENIKRETRRYAKRQMTWFRRDERVKWLKADTFADYEALRKAAEGIVTEAWRKRGD